MALAFRWLLRIFVVLLVLSLAALTLVYYFASRSLPDYNAEYVVSGTQEPIQIIRDHANVPHIMARTDEDAYFGLGLAHAQDRLWQMTLRRRRAQGRLSEVFGPRTLRTDELMRRLDIYRLSVRSVEAMDAPTRAALEAYSRGVNAWIDIVNRDAMGRGAPEFFMFSNAIAPWQPADSVALGKLLAFESSDQIGAEVLRARLSLRLEDDRLRDIQPLDAGPVLAALPEEPDERVGDGTRGPGTARPVVSAEAAPIAVPGAAAGPAGAATEAAQPVPDDNAPPTPTPPNRIAQARSAPLALVGASNGWAAAPSRSASGSTLLANDPNSLLTAPTEWYLARLELRSGGVIGATMPGMPQIMAGRSARLGWGLTSAFGDDMDLYVERLNPDNGQEYATDDGFARFRTEGAVIRVKDAPPVTITLRWSRNGPILPGNHFGLRNITPKGHVIALSWTGLSETDTTIAGFRALMNAADTQEALAAGADFVAPSYNLIIADSDRIAMQTVGALPDRNPDQQGNGRMPSPGWIAANTWAGLLPYTDNPRFSGPSGSSSNSGRSDLADSLDSEFPRNLSGDLGDQLRILRWRRLMQSRGVHTRESFIEAQLDTVSAAARNILPLIARDLWFSGTAPAKGTPERKRQDALELLANWNGEMNEHLPEPLIYAAWARNLQRLLIRDELGPLADELSRLRPVFIERVFRNLDGASAWCDVIQSAPRETCTDVSRAALDTAIVELEETYGAGLESLRWGDAHQARHNHEVLGDIPFLSWVVNIRQSTSGGDHTLERGLTAATGKTPYANIQAAGYRGVYDFADPDSSVFVTATGQSGHPLSRFYDNLGELWRRGEYIPMSLDPELAAAAAVGHTILRPRQTQ